MRTSSSTSDTPGTLVILTRVEGLLRAGAARPCDVPQRTLRVLAACQVPLVFVSDSPAQDVRQLQRELGVTAPFICERGAALLVPPDDDGDGLRARPWAQHRFVPPDMAAAVTVLREILTVRRGRDILMVGLGCAVSDYGFLAAVDIPIVVRQHDADQASLLHRLPNVYVTRSAGAVGWSEALLGSPLQ